MKKIIGWIAVICFISLMWLMACYIIGDSFMASLIIGGAITVVVLALIISYCLID